MTGTNKKKMIITLPEDPSLLEGKAIEVYESTARFAKSRKMLQLLEAGVVLKELGLLEYVIGEGTTMHLSKGENVVKRHIYSMIQEKSVTEEHKEPGSGKPGSGKPGSGKPGSGKPEEVPAYEAGTAKGSADIGPSSNKKGKVDKQNEAHNQVLKVEEGKADSKRNSLFSRDGGMGNLMSVQGG